MYNKHTNKSIFRYTSNCDIKYQQISLELQIYEQQNSHLLGERTFISNISSKYLQQIFHQIPSLQMSYQSTFIRKYLTKVPSSANISSKNFHHKYLIKVPSSANISSKYFHSQISHQSTFILSLQISNAKASHITYVPVSWWVSQTQ